MYCVSSWDESKQAKRRMRKTLDDSALEKYLGKTFTYPEVKEDLVNLAREGTRSAFARYCYDEEEPRRGWVEAFRASDRVKFEIFTRFNQSAQIRKFDVYYYLDPTRQLCEMSDPELREHRGRHIRSMEDEVSRLQKELLTIDEELQRRGLATE